MYNILNLHNTFSSRKNNMNKINLNKINLYNVYIKINNTYINNLN